MTVAGWCGMFILWATLSVWAADGPKKPMVETATVRADANVQKRLGTVNDYLVDKRWSEAVDILHEIAQSDGRSLVNVQPGYAGGSALSLNVATQCQVLLSRMPQEGLTAYRRKVDPQAKRWFENWQRTRDEAELERLIRQAYLSSYGDDALWALGEAAWDRGDFDSARLSWSQLIPVSNDSRAGEQPTVLRYPDSSFDEASVYARLILCSLMEGQQSRANDEQRRFEELFPQAEGSLEGRQGKLFEILRQILDEATAWEATVADAEVGTFGIAPERTRILPSVLDVGAPRWEQPLTPNVLPPWERLSANLDRGPLSTHPVVFRDIVFVNDAESISAFHLLTGEPAWPTENGTAQIYPPIPEERSSSPLRRCVGVPWYTMTVSDGKLFARMGSPVTLPSDNEPRALANDLVCLDISTGQGKLLWKISAEEWNRDGEQKWRFEGTPLVKEGRAYLIHSRRHPQMEFAVSCLDATKGERLWTRPLSSARSSVEDHQNRVSHLLPTLGAGRLFLSTDAGAIFAVDARDGRAEWAVTYESRSVGDAADQSDHARQGLVPAMFHEGLLFVAPNDSDRLFCIEADSGRVRWQKSQPRSDRWRHLLGVSSGVEGDLLIVSGKRLSALNAETGREAWKISPGDNTEAGYGRGVLAGDVVFWPTREEIRIVETATGQPRRNVPLNTPDSSETGGNLTIAGGMLLVAQPEKLVAYGEYSLLKERLHRKLSAHPDQPEFLLKLAEIEVSSGNLAEAVKLLQSVRQQAENGKSISPDSLRREQLARLLDQMRRVSRRMIDEGHVERAIAALTDMLSFTGEPSERMNVLFDLADAEMVRQQPAVAIAHWQQILDDVRLRACSRHETTAEAEASTAISRTIAQHGRTVYVAVEQQAAREIAACKATADLPGMRRLLQQYPQAESTTQTWLELATLERQAGRFQAASSIAARMSTDAVLPTERAAATIVWGESLEAAGYWRTSQRVWNRLADADLADQLVEFGGRSQTGHNLARERLSRPEYARYERKESPKVAYLERAWMADLDRANSGVGRDANPITVIRPAQVFVPQGVAPSRELACVLVSRVNGPLDSEMGTLECLDRETGAGRWRLPQAMVPRWVAYAETQLLVATDDELKGLTLEHGRTLWTVPFDRKARVSLPLGLEFELREHWVVVFDPRSGVTLIDSRSGEIAWTLQPRGRLQPKWSCGARHLALQTLQPALTLVVQIAADRHVTELAGLGEPWRCAPVIDDLQRVTLVSDTRRIECHASRTTSPLWTFRGGMSFAHADPVLWTTGDRLLLTVDGTTLTEVHRENGGVVWSAGLCDLPLSDPARHVVATHEAAFVASRGLLRSIALDSGQCRWEQFLGREESSWHVVLCGPLIATWPETPQASSPASVVWCDAASGRIVQRLRMPRPTKSISVTADDSGTLVLTETTAMALAPISVATSEPIASPGLR